VSIGNIYKEKRPRRSTMLDIRGFECHLNEWGEDDQPLVVYLHGWGDCGATFQFVADAMSADTRIVAPDWRGFGRSSHVGTSYWFPDYLADLDALLGHLSPDEPAILVGHSMGANVAGLYAGSMPERVRAFVNIEGFGLKDSDPDHAPQNYRRWIERGRTPERWGSYASLDELVPRILKRSPRLSADRARFVAREWTSDSVDGVYRLRADPHHRLPNAVQYRRAEAVACWDRVAAPVLLVLGEESDFTAAAQSWIDPDESIHPFRGAPTARIPGAGHMVHFEAPDALAAAIGRFLADL